MNCLKKKMWLPPCSYDNHSNQLRLNRVGRINKSPREKLKSEKRPTEYLPGNNSSSSNESKEKSNKIYIGSGEETAISSSPSLLLWEVRLGGTGVT